MPDTLLSLPAPFLVENGWVRMQEPPDAPVEVLRQQLLDGTYDKPFIVDDDELRYLYLGATFIQSVMRRDQPDALDVRYTQKMMAFLLFNRAPRRIVMLGLGGGSLAKFCYRVLPQADITIIEIDPRVMALRPHFAIPADDDRFRVIRGDAAEFVAGTAEGRIDVLLADAFDDRGLAQSVGRREFLKNAHAALDGSGVLVMNLAGEESRYIGLIEDARDIFDLQTILVPVKDDDNLLLFAFKQRLFEPNWRQLKRRAQELKANLDLDFPAFVQRMERASKERQVCWP